LVRNTGGFVIHKRSMSVHKFLQIKEGGYFYRFYPKLKSWPQRDLYDSDTVDESHLPVITDFKSIDGVFKSKWKDKTGCVIHLQHSGTFGILDHITTQIENRHIQSELHVWVSEDVYAYNFRAGRPYSIYINSVAAL
jgi:hypothetical protein